MPPANIRQPASRKNTRIRIGELGCRQRRERKWLKKWSGWDRDPPRGQDLSNIKRLTPNESHLSFGKAWGGSGTTRGRRTRRTARAAAAAPRKPFSNASTSHEPWPSFRVQSLPQPFGSGQNPAAWGGRRGTCPHLSLARHQPAVPTEFPTTLGQAQPPQPPSLTRCPLSGARFWAASRCQTAGCPDLPLRLPPSSSTSGSGGGSDGGGTPQSIVGMASRGPAQSAGRNQKRRKGGGVRLRTGVGPGRSACAAEVGCLARPPPVQRLASVSYGPGTPGFNSRLWGLDPVSLERCHRPDRADFCLPLRLSHRRLKTLICAFTLAGGWGGAGGVGTARIWQKNFNRSVTRVFPRRVPEPKLGEDGTKPSDPKPNASPQWSFWALSGAPTPP